MRSTGKLRDLRAATDLALRAAQSASKPAPRPATAPATIRIAATPTKRSWPRSRVRLFWLLDSLPARALRRLLGRSVGRVLEVVAYALLALWLGLFSAWYAIDFGTGYTVQRDGPWRRWMLAGAPDADPYTRAHFASTGGLPLAAGAAAYFTANRDTSGEPLYSDCDYALTGLPPKSARWTLAAFDLDGDLIEAGAGPNAVSSDTALPGPGGSVAITLSQSVSPGNWLSLSGETRMQLVLTVYGLQQKAAQSTAGAEPRSLFQIERTACP